MDTYGYLLCAGTCVHILQVPDLREQVICGNKPIWIQVLIFPKKIPVGQVWVNLQVNSWWALNWSDTLHNHLISQQMNFDAECERIAAHQFMLSLNMDQQYAFQEIWQSIIYDEGKIFFVNGFGGCGKTYLYQAICHAVWAEGIIILCVTSTGLTGLLCTSRWSNSTFNVQNPHWYAW